MKDNNLAKYLSIFVAFVALVGAILFIRVFMEDVDALESDATIQASVVNPIVYFSKINMSDIAVKVTSIIVDKLGVEESEVTNEASFTNDLGADSLDTVELIMEFEKEFNIAIPDEQAEKIATVGDAVTYITENAG